jgi:hypothetical protein
VRHLLTACELKHAHTTVLDLGELERYKRPLPLMKEYDLMLSTAEVTR